MWLECWTCVHLLVNVLCFIILLELIKCQFTFYEAIFIKSRRSKLCVSYVA